MNTTERIVSIRGVYDTPVSARAREVRSAREIIRKARVVELMKQWEIDDRKEAGLRGARGPFADSEQIFIIYLLLVRKEKPTSLRAATSLVRFGMKCKAREELGLDIGDATGDQIYSRLHRSFQRFLSIIDPYPAPKRCKMTKAEFDALNAEADKKRQGILQERCRTVFNKLILATIPRWVRRRSKGNVAIDGTLVAAYGQNGTKTRSDYVGIEPYAGYYVRSEDHYFDPELKYTRQDIKGWGWEAALVVLGTNDPYRESTIPQLITGMNLATPGAQPGKSAIHALKHMHQEDLPAEDKFKAGILVGDRIYGNTPVAADFQIPARALGYELVFDLKEEYWGRTYEMDGAVILEGHAYSPSILGRPKLINATIDRYRDKNDPDKIDDTTYQRRLEQRRQYRVQFRTAQNSDGSRQGLCPAAGPNPTLHCPLRAIVNSTVTKDGKTLLPVTQKHVPSEYQRGGLCNNKGGTMVLRGPYWDKHAMAADFQFGTDYWHDNYTSLRQNVESVNSQLKNGDGPALAASDRRRTRGFTAAFFFSALIVMQHNLKTLGRWTDPKMDSQGRGPRREIKPRLRDKTYGRERNGILKGQTKPPDVEATPYEKVIVGIE